MIAGWLTLAGAIAFEIVGTTCLKLSEGLSRPAPSLGVLVFYGASFACLSQALKRFELGVAYAVWSGLGTAIVAAIGMTWFREPASALKLVSLALVIAGVVGLNLGQSGR
jgi:small multidrug resistance pump